MKKLSDREIGSLAIAAFRAGHRICCLKWWLAGTWSARDLFLKGKAIAAGPFPLPEIDELEAAIDDLATHLPLGEQRDAMCLARDLADWKYQAVQLHKFAADPIGHDLEDEFHEESSPPGQHELFAVEQIVSTTLATGHPLLRAWYELGEVLGQHDGRTMTANEIDEPVRCLNRLIADGRYEFLVPLRDALSDHRKGLTSGIAKVVGDESGESACIFQYIVKSLRNVALPPLITVYTDGLRYFNTDFRRQDFRAAEWSILMALAAKPRQWIDAAELVRVAGLGCQPIGVAPHVSRLRQKLRPAVERFYRNRSDGQPGRAQSFLRGGTNQEDEPNYDLSVDPLLVQVVNGRMPTDPRTEVMRRAAQVHRLEDLAKRAAGRRAGKKNRPRHK
jgi:hypothetical protein